MKILFTTLVLTFIMSTGLVSEHFHFFHFFEEKHDLCGGLLPPNDLNIPVSEGVRRLSSNQIVVSGISEQQFNSALDRFESVFAPQVKSQGEALVVLRLWSNGEVNAYAQKQGRNRIIAIYGGLARYPTMTEDGLLLVACHELGHHYGGAPIYPDPDPDSDLMSSEGQADYYATAKCFRQLYTEEENLEWLQSAQVEKSVVSYCDRLFVWQVDWLSCIRGSQAGHALASVFARFEGKPNPSITTPDKSVVSKTFVSHPRAQCRYDTYVNGAFCSKPFYDSFSFTDLNKGACEKNEGYEIGYRPRCWFAP